MSTSTPGGAQELVLQEAQLLRRSPVEPESVHELLDVEPPPLVISGDLAPVALERRQAIPQQRHQPPLQMVSGHPFMDDRRLGQPGQQRLALGQRPPHRPGTGAVLGRRQVVHAPGVGHLPLQHRQLLRHLEEFTRHQARGLAAAAEPVAHLIRADHVVCRRPVQSGEDVAPVGVGVDPVGVGVDPACGVPGPVLEFDESFRGPGRRLP